MIISILVLSNINNPDIFSQDLFGAITTNPTKYMNKVKVSPLGDLYSAVWGVGVFKNNNIKNAWTIQSNGLTNPFVTDIEFINNNEILVSTMGGGVFKTNTLPSINWTATNKGLTNLNVKTLKMYTNGWILAGTYGGGIYLSKDKGENWVLSSKGLNYRDITSIEVSDNGWILAGTYGGGIYQSRDTAKTWTKQNSGLKNLFINDIELSSKGYLYAATNGRGVYMSPNHGIVWSELDTFMVRNFNDAPSPLPDLNATCLAMTSTGEPIFGSRYGGVYIDDQVESFSWISTALRGFGTNSLASDGSKIIVANAMFGPKKITFPAKTTDQISELPMSGFVEGPKVLSRGEKKLIVYSGLSIKSSTDDGASWISLPLPNNGTSKLDIHKISVDSSGNYYACTNSGLYKSDPSISQWSFVAFNDTIVYDCEFSPNGYAFAVTRYFNQPLPPAQPMDKSDAWMSEDGLNFVKTSIEYERFGPIPTQIPVSPAGDVYISGGKFIYFSKNNGKSWNLTNTFDTDINCFAFLKDNTLLVGTAGSGLYKSTNIIQFTKITSYPKNNIEAIAVGRNDEIYASGMNILVDNAFASYNATYVSKDSGATFVSINNSFNGENVTSFDINSVNDTYMCTASGMIYRAIDSTNLGTPKLLTVKDKALDMDIDSVFSWTSANRAELYQIEISYYDDFTFVQDGATTSDTFYINNIALENNHTYYWRVRSKNHSAVSPWSEVRTFSTKIARPNLVSPLDKSQDIAVYANLVWNSVESAQQYKMQIAKNKDFSPIVYEWLTKDTTTKSDLLEGKTQYYWRVMAFNDKSTSNWSDVWSFETVFGPPLLNSPADSSSGNAINVLMTWKKANEVDEYDIQIANDNKFANVVFESTAINGINIEAQNLDYDTEYFWRVRSRKGDVYSEWSEEWSFRTAYSPVNLINPNDNAVNISVKTEFEWQAHSTQNNYEIEIAQNTDFSNNTDFATVNDNTKFNSTKLDYFKNYYWRVRAISEVNTGIWSNPFTFKTRIGAVGLRLPLDKSIDHPVSVNFMWFEMSGAKSYHLQIANDSIFNDLLFSQDTITSTKYTFSDFSPASSYYWRVRAISEDGPGDWSEVWSFSTGKDIPVLIAPENGDEKVILPVKFEWLQVGGATKYELMISEDADFDPILLDKTNITGIMYVAEDLLKNKTYYWKVRAVNNEGTLPWSQIWSFSTKDPNSVNDSEVGYGNLFVHPNPAEDFIIISLDNNNEYSNKEIQIFDLLGSKVAQSILLEGNNKIDISNLTSGTYFVKVGDRIESFIKK